MLPNKYKTKDGEKDFYQEDIKQGDVIEAFDWKLVAKELDFGEKYEVKYLDVTLDSKSTENFSTKDDRQEW